MIMYGSGERPGGGGNLYLPLLFFKIDWNKIISIGKYDSGSSPEAYKLRGMTILREFLLER